ncbi:hypothetical protein BASA83_011675 [Batrachochytrium salamandrivorans]|nr:hypothetical protein BASA83_011675 [Batrachochytrium salamandrivorans]
MMLKSDLNWNEQALMHQFRAGLANEVKDMLLHHEHPDSLDKLLLLATRIDARLLEHRQDRQLGRQTGTHTARFVHSPVLPRNTSSHPTMMDVDAIRRQQLTPAEREHRFRNGLCLVCGTQGHLKATCPSRRQVAGISRNSTTTLATTPDEPTSKLSENYSSQ